MKRPTRDLVLLGRCVRAKRRAARLGQRGLAKQAGVSATTVLRLERGDHTSLEHAQAVLAALGCSLIVVHGRHAIVERTT